MALRVLHVVEPGSLDWPALAALGFLTDRAGPARDRHELLCVGGSPDAERLRQAGIDAPARVTPAIGALAGADRTIERIMRRTGPFDCVHAWSARAVQLAVASAGPTPVIGTLSAAPAARPGRSLRKALTRLAHLQFTHRSLSAAWQSWGAPALNASSSLLPLAIDRVAPGSRDGLRESWRVPEGEPVVLACGFPASAVNARWFSYQTGVMSVAGLRATVVIPDGAAQAERGLRFAQRHTEPWRVVLDRRPVWEVAPGADLALWSMDGVSAGLQEGGLCVTPPDSLAWCAATGVPVVCEDHEASRGALAGLEDRARFVRASRPTALIDEVMETLRSAGAGPSVSVPAERDASAWVERAERLHRTVAGRPRPLAPVTA